MRTPEDAPSFRTIMVVLGLALILGRVLGILADGVHVGWQP